MLPVDLKLIICPFGANGIGTASSLSDDESGSSMREGSLTSLFGVHPCGRSVIVLSSYKEQEDACQGNEKDGCEEATLTDHFISHTCSISCYNTQPITQHLLNVFRLHNVVKTTPCANQTSEWRKKETLVTVNVVLVGARWAALCVSETDDLLGFSATIFSKVYREYPAVVWMKMPF